MLTLAVPAWEVVVRTVVVYLVILAGLRLAGKREIGQMTVFDLVVVLLISNAVQNAMVGQDSSLLGGVIAAAVLLLLDASVARLRLRSPRLRRVLEGSPTLLVLRGAVIADHMRREGVDQEELEAALRENGVADLSDVEMAVLEIDGAISVVRAGDHVRRIKRPWKYGRRP
ncbi:MAG: DUF421 domain-containing protein [Chloroflexi bacterium]|nr:DUF421 domain-containing protein [Chloroflexota bacterium]